MQIKSLAGAACVVWLGAQIAVGQEVSEVESLKRQFQQLQAQFEKQQQLQRQQLEALSRQIEVLQTARPPAPLPPAVASRPPVGLGALRSDTAPITAPIAAPPLAEKPWSPADPIKLFGGGQSYLNLSFDGLFAVGGSTAKDIEKLETGGHDPKQRGFTVENIETTFEGRVDPYFRGQAALVHQIDTAGESFVELEEAYVESLALPWNLQLRAGQFFTEFGRQNQTHPHAWSFVDQPLIMGRLLGDDGLRSAGMRLSWLTPTPFYSELYLTVQNSQGPTAHSFRNGNGGAAFFGRTGLTQGSVKGVGDMLFAPRYVASFNLTDAQTLVLGSSAAFGPNSTGGTTQIYAVDSLWKWKSANHHAGFPFVSWETEAMLRRFKASEFAGDPGAGTPPLPAETLTDYGVYSQLLYGFSKGWVAGLRGDFVNQTKAGAYEAIVGRDPDRDQRWRLSPNLTWYPSEFSKVRLQYNYDQRAHIGLDHSLWLQFEFLLGSHAAHKF